MYVCIWDIDFLNVLLNITTGSNLMSGVPFEIGTCTKLVELDMSYNAIQVSGSRKVLMIASIPCPTSCPHHHHHPLLQTLPISLAACSNLERLHLGR
jgi:Leucine-rich repeat (LRR) protein